MLLALVVVPLRALAPSTRAQATAIGCTTTPRPPVTDERSVIARADAECSETLAGHEIITELWQQDGSGDWQRVE